MDLWQGKLPRGVRDPRRRANKAFVPGDDIATAGVPSPVEHSRWHAPGDNKGALVT